MAASELKMILVISSKQTELSDEAINLKRADVKVEQRDHVLTRWD